MSAPIRYEKHGNVGVLIFNRPDALNPLGQPGDGVFIENLLADICGDTDVRCCVLTGEGRAFSAGGDVKAMKRRDGLFSGSKDEIEQAYVETVHRIVKAFWRFELPLIAAVNGPAVGLGCDVACLADLRLISEKGRFGMSFLKIGLIAGDGGSWLMPRIVGLARATEMIFTAGIYDADTAVEWGWASRKVAAEDLLSSAMELAAEIAKQPPLALRSAKRLLRAGQNNDYETVMAMSAQEQAILHETEDHMEGVTALLEKRVPVFQGK